MAAACAKHDFVTAYKQDSRMSKGGKAKAFSVAFLPSLS